jgi:hypothetical protein
VWINTGRLGYSLRGRRGLSVRVGNTTKGGLYWKRESNLDNAGALCSQTFTQEFNLKIYLFLRDVYKVNVVYFLEHNVFDFI